MEPELWQQPMAPMPPREEAKRDLTLLREGNAEITSGYRGFESLPAPAVFSLREMYGDEI